MNIEEQIKEMLATMKPEAFSAAIERMKIKADKGLLNGVSSDDINKAVNAAFDGEENTKENDDLLETISKLELEIANAISLYESFEPKAEDVQYNILEDEKAADDFLSLLEDTPIENDIIKSTYMNKLMEAEHE